MVNEGDVEEVVVPDPEETEAEAFAVAAAAVAAEEDPLIVGEVTYYLCTYIHVYV